MIDMLWYIVWPVVIFIGINISVNAIFSWIILGKNIYDSSGSLSFGTDIMEDNSVIIMLITMLIAIPIMIVLMKKDEDRRGFLTFKQHFKKIDFKGFLWLIPLGICMCLGISKLVTLFPIDNILGSYEKTLEGYKNSGLVVRILTLCILVPIGEELVYRGLFYKRLKKYYETTIAAYLSAILFGVAHMNLVQGIYGFILAMIIIYVYEKYNTIFAPIFLHIMINIMALISGEFDIFSKINDVLIAKLFFMLVEIAGIVLFVRIIRVKKQELT